MNKQRPINIVLAKSCSLCLIFALVGCFPTTVSPFTSINTSADTLTKTTLPSHSIYIPAESTEQTDWLITLPDQPNQLQHDSLMLQLYGFPANSEIEHEIVTDNKLSKGQSPFTDLNSSTDQLPISNYGSFNLPNSGGGGGGGRRSIQHGML